MESRLAVGTAALRSPGTDPGQEETSADDCREDASQLAGRHGHLKGGLREA